MKENNAKPIFEIKNLVCSYSCKAEEGVLRIKELLIPKGELVFILGASGSGKSTLLETLGLMNNTIADGEIFFNTGKDEEIKFSALWRNHEKELTAIRKKYYSFIFQNTNLMENFTAYENISLAEMIKSGNALNETTNNVKDILEKVKLSSIDVNESTLPVNLSGGQRQRLSFVRAFSTHPLILFGDEPTGNLDEENANELFRLIKETVTSGATAIIVSHNVDLALSFADRIIILTKDIQKGYGEALPENIFTRSYWAEFNATEKLSFRKKISSFYSSNIDTIQEKTREYKKSLQNKKISFRTLFFLREFKALAEKKWVNFIILCTLLFITFFAIGFANGSLDYLDKKLKDPFVNWLTIPVPFSKAEDAEANERIKKKLNDPGIMLRYNFKDPSEFCKDDYELCNDSNPNNTNYIAGRTFKPEKDKNLIANGIFTRDNIVYARDNGFRKNQDVGIIVTQQLLADLKYPKNARYIYFLLRSVKNADNDKGLPVQIPIRAIVKNLPGKIRIGVTEYFDNSWLNINDNSYDYRNNFNHLKILCPYDSATSAKIFNLIREKANKIPEVATNDSYIHIDKHTDTWASGYDITIDLHSRVPSYKSFDTIFTQLKNYAPIKSLGDSLEKIPDFSEINPGNNPIYYHYISIYFTRLNKVRDFADYIHSMNTAEDISNPIEVDISAVIDKENFNFLSSTAWCISILVIILGTIGVCIFLFNLLKKHLTKVKMNIGTYKAIGLSDGESFSIYFVIIIVFLIFGILVSLIVAQLLGILLNYLLPLFGDLMLEKNTSYFNLFETNTCIAILIIVIFGSISSYFVIRRILVKSPGDLIYNR